MKIMALAYGDKFSIDAHYDVDKSIEVAEHDGALQENVLIQIEKIVISFEGLSDIDITEIFTTSQMFVLIEQIYAYQDF
jgi:hypothetical protein